MIEECDSLEVLRRASEVPPNPAIALVEEHGADVLDFLRRINIFNLI